jgi:branched-chain amino acid transport system substrate-binding protein
MLSLRGVLLAAALALLPSVTSPAEALTINVILPLTGANTFIGQGMKKGYEALEISVNADGGLAGQKLSFAFHDDQTNPQVDVQLVGELLASSPAIILGPASTGGCRAVAPLVKQGPVLYCLSPSLHAQPGSYAFSINISTPDQIYASVRYFVQRGAKRIATITSTDANGQDADAAINAAADDMNAQRLIVDREHFGAGDLSVSAQIAKIKAANPDVLFAWTTGTPFGTVLHGLRDVGLGVPVLTTSANSNRALITQFAALLPKELYFPDYASEIGLSEIPDVQTRRAVQAFRAAMVAVGVAKPDEAYSAGWDAGLLVVEAYRKLGAAATALQIHDFFASTKGWVGTRGPYDFRAYPQRGLSQSSVVMARWDAATDAWVAVSKPGGAPVR